MIVVGIITIFLILTSQLPVQVKKNPGLGFSIAGGVAGAETVRVTRNNLH